MFIGWLIGIHQGSKWDGICRYGIPALLSSAWSHTATSFRPTAIPVCRRPLNSCKICSSLCNARNLSGKSLKLLWPDAFLRRKICQKCACGRGSGPDPTVGAYSAPPGPLAGFKGKGTAGEGGEQGRWGRQKEKGERGRDILVLLFPHSEPWCWFNHSFVSSHPATSCNGRRPVGGGRMAELRRQRLVEVAPYEHFFCLFSVLCRSQQSVLHSWQAAWASTAEWLLRPMVHVYCWNMQTCNRVKYEIQYHNLSQNENSTVKYIIR